MSKQELYAQITAKGLDRNFNGDSLWQQAFNLYNTGRYQKLKMSCSGCYRTVLEWLKN